MVSEKINPELTGVPETLLIPLWARAMEQSQTTPLIVDPDSARIVESLQYDFSAFHRKQVEAENFCVRSRVMDQLLSEILAADPGRTVVEFGPGLDTRFQRLGHLAGRWVEVDLPEVVALREQFFESHPARTTISCSMLDPAWRAACQGLEQPPLFIAEGVFYFFSRQQIRTLLSSIWQEFPGADFVFDAISPLYLRLSNWRHPLTTSHLQFSLGPGATEISEWDSTWSVSRYIGYGDSPWYDSVMHRFAWWKRAAVKLLPPARHAFMVVHASASEGISENDHGC